MKETPLGAKSKPHSYNKGNGRIGNGIFSLSRSWFLSNRIERESLLSATVQLPRSTSTQEAKAKRIH